MGSESGTRLEFLFHIVVGIPGMDEVGGKGVIFT